MGKDRAASEVGVAEVVAHYLAIKEEGARRPRELAARVGALLAFWGDKTLDDITTRTCRDYVAQRTTSAQARRELEDLRAACRMAIADNVTRHAVTVTLPPKPKGRVKHLDRSQMAKLVHAAYRKREVQRGIPTKKRPTLHVARFLLVAVYTGSRSGRVWQASFVREPGRPFIDLEAGVFYRAPEDEQIAANKQAPPIRLPGCLLAHLRRWRRGGARYVCEYQGRPADPKRAFRKLVKEVLGKDAEGVVRHTLRHTSATWLMQASADMWESAGYLGMTRETLEKTYGHHHPDHQAGVGRAFTSGRAGRQRA
ncbi:integrase [Amorphus orientalis]|uniref:Integrase n=1 Tax=Amorphus orientalis TaxID=649198 RepID=A0AAE3VTJ8_9HYPH|nr:integrase [Amorphus orientalis]MDQ0317346.1 integrase [Amorphus orientalis]